MNKLAGGLVLLLLLCTQAGCWDRAPKTDRDLAVAREAYTKGYYLEAESAYERYLQSRQDGAYRTEAWDRLLNIALNIKNDLDRSASLLEAMYLESGADPKRGAVLLHKMGDIYERKGERDRALANYEKALSAVEPTSDEASRIRLDIVRLYRKQGNYDLAIETLKNCVRDSSDDAFREQCRYELAQTYGFIKSWDMTRETLETLLHSDGATEETTIMATLLLADVYEQERQPQKARELLESIRTIHPNPMVIDARIKNLGDNAWPENAIGDDY